MDNPLPIRTGKVAVLGAGSIGAYVGGALLGAGADVTLLGRARMRQRIAEHGLHLTDLHGRELLLDGARVPYVCLLYTSPSPRDRQKSRMPSSA